MSNRPTVFLDPSGMIIYCPPCEAAKALAEGVQARTEAVVSGVTHAVETGLEAARGIASFADSQVIRAQKWLAYTAGSIPCVDADGVGDFFSGVYNCGEAAMDFVKAAYSATPKPVRRCLVGGAIFGAVSAYAFRNISLTIGGFAIGCTLGAIRKL